MGLIVAGCPGAGMRGAGAQEVRINEFVARNDAGLRDEAGVREDWIELHNRSLVEVDLAGWRLTDEETNLARWIFPSRLLAPGEFLIVFASGKDRRPATGNVHTNFRIDGDGGDFLALVRPDGVVADSFALREQFSYDGQFYCAPKDFSTLGLQINTEAWEAAGLTPNTIPTPVTGHGMVFVMSGFQGNSIQAIKLTARGDVSDTASVVWNVRKSAPYVPSPVLSGERLYMSKTNDAYLSCLNALTGEVHYQDQKLEDLRGGITEVAGLSTAAETIHKLKAIAEARIRIDSNVRDLMVLESLAVQLRRKTN